MLATRSQFLGPSVPGSGPVTWNPTLPGVNENDWPVRVWRRIADFVNKGYVPRSWDELRQSIEKVQPDAKANGAFGDTLTPEKVLQRRELREPEIAAVALFRPFGTVSGIAVHS